MISYEYFLKNLEDVYRRIRETCKKCCRNPKDIKLLPVTKNHPDKIIEYCQRAGLMAVGENRVQEASQKKASTKFHIKWELVGHLQSNKVKQAIATFDRIQSVDTEKLLEKIDKISSSEDIVMPIMIEVNAGNDPAKHGVALDEAEKLTAMALNCRHVKLEGLMTIAPLSENKLIASKTFRELRRLRDDIERKLKCSLPELSMGMSGDLEEAITEGSTLIRIGNSLFGER